MEELLQVVKYLGVGIGTGIAIVASLFIKRLLAKVGIKQTDDSPAALSRSVHLYSRIQKRADFCQHDLGASRVMVIEFHNGGHFLSSKQVFRLTCTIEANNKSASIKNEIQNLHVSVFVPQICHLFGEESATGCDMLEVIDKDGKAHQISRAIENDIDEGVMKTLMVTNGIEVMFCVPLKNQDGHLIGLVNAHYMDEKWQNPDNVPETLYKLAHLAYNVQADIMAEESSDDGPNPIPSTRKHSPVGGVNVLNSPGG